jgi:hypothetical protein
MLDRPPFPGWARYAAFGIGAALLSLIVIVLIVLFSRPAPPHIDVFNLLTPNVEQGQPILIEWQALNASELGVYIDGVLVAPLDGQNGQVEIASAGYLGAVTLELRAENSTASDSETRTVQVAPSLALNDLTVTPISIYRYTLQTLDIAWSANAAATQITGLEAFSTSPITTSFGASGSLSVTGIWQSPLPMTVRITATDATGQVVIRDQIIETLPVTCRAAVGDVAVYSAPDSRGQVIATVRAEDGGTIDITGRDLNGTWLRTALSGGAQGWVSRSLLDCTLAESNGLLTNLLLVPDVATALPNVILNTPTPTRIIPLVPNIPVQPTATAQG